MKGWEKPQYVFTGRVRRLSLRFSFVAGKAREIAKTRRPCRSAERASDFPAQRISGLIEARLLFAVAS